MTALDYIETLYCYHRSKNIFVSKNFSTTAATGAIVWKLAFSIVTPKFQPISLHESCEIFVVVFHYNIGLNNFELAEVLFSIVSSSFHTLQ